MAKTKVGNQRVQERLTRDAQLRNNRKNINQTDMAPISPTNFARSLRNASASPATSVRGGPRSLKAA
jgi:hypothetical protein